MLPAKFSCPLCGELNLEIYRDYLMPAEWVRCWGCDFIGDPVQLAAKYWEIDACTAGVKLGMSKSLNDLEMLCYKSAIDRRQLITDLWKNAQQMYPFDNSKVIRHLQHKFGLTAPLDRQRWDSRMGRFVGGSTRQLVEEAFQPACRFTKRKGNVGRQRAFTGPGWGDLLLIPYYDLPGRISGVLCVGREGRDIDFVFRKAPMSRSKADSGVAMLDAVNKSINIDDSIFVVVDPICALKLQHRHFKDNSTMLPVVAGMPRKHNTDPGIMWSSLPVKRLVYCGPLSEELEVFRQAYTADAYLAPFYSSHGEMFKKLYKPMTEKLKETSDSARHWLEALEIKLIDDNVHDGYFERLLTYFDLQDHGIRNVIKKCSSSKSKARLERIFNIKRGLKSVTVNSHTVSETPNGWVNEDTGEVICDAILRIDEVIYKRSDKEMYYKGRIIYKGEEVRFCEIDRSVEIGTMRWMRKKLIQAGKGLISFNRSWSADAIHIATQFNKPKCSTYDGKVGWNQETNSFRFPNFVVTATGELLDDSLNIAASTPAAGNITVAPMTAADLAELSINSEETIIGWAVMAGLLYNVLAPAVNKPTVGIGMVGQQAIELGRAAVKALGCREVIWKKGKKYALEETERTMKAEKINNFPILIDSSRIAAGNVLRRWAEITKTKRNCFVGVDKFNSRICIAQGNWRVFEYNKPLSETEFNYQALSKSLPWLLQAICKNGLISIASGDLMAHVFLAITSWAKEQTITVEPIKVAEKLYPSINHDRLAAFAETMISLYCDGDLQFVRGGTEYSIFSVPCQIIFFDTDGGQIFIPKAAIRHALRRRKAIQFSELELKKLLIDSGVLINEIVYRGSSGWLIKESHWNDWLQSYGG